MFKRLRARVRERLAGRVWPFAAALLRIVAEAGWLTVLYAAGSVLADKQAPVIGPIGMVGFVGAGVLIGVIGRRQPALGAFLVIGGVIAGGALGSMAGQDLRALGGDWLHALGVHFAGWLAGIAVLRGAMVSIGENAAEQLEQMLRVVPFLIGVLWAYTTYAAREELWLSFWVAALWGTAMYLSASLLGIGMARLNLLHAEVTDVRQRRAWRWLVLAVGLAIVPVTIPVAVLGGVPLAAMLSPIVGPIQWLLSLLAYPLAFIIWILSIVLRPVAGPLSELMDQIGRNVTVVEQDPTATRDVATIFAALISAATLLLIALAIFFAARWLLIRHQTPAEETETPFTDIERSIVLPGEPKRPPARRRFRRGQPHDAVAAYLSTLLELDTHGELARRPAETPAAHAARLRAHAEVRGVDLARLAADYQLARYGARDITRLENLRAVGRFRRIRQSLSRSRGMPLGRG